MAAPLLCFLDTFPGLVCGPDTPGGTVSSFPTELGTGQKWNQPQPLTHQTQPCGPHQTSGCSGVTGPGGDSQGQSNPSTSPPSDFGFASHW